MEQFKTSQREALKKQGIIIYIPNQDGRGHGSEFKMANQRLMNDCRMDTIAVAERFYRSHDKIDIRTFDEAVHSYERAIESQPRNATLWDERAMRSV